MKISHKAILIGLLSLLAAGVYSNDNVGVAQNTSPVIDQIIPQIDAVKRLPVSGVVAIDSQGRTVFMSDNGRFVFMGAKLYDTWNRQYLDTMAEINDWADKIDLDRLGLPLDELAALPYGKGKKRVVIYIDPYCPYCEKLLAQLPELVDEYTFQLLVVPFLGERSGKLVRRMSCGLQQGISRTEMASIMVEKRYNDLPDDDTSCNVDHVEKLLLTAKLTGVQGVPFTIAPNGSYQPGYVEDLSKWLADVESKDRVSNLPNESFERGE
jgi:thiol:disulfide interchange protein DsbC